MLSRHQVHLLCRNDAVDDENHYLVFNVNALQPARQVRGESRTRVFLMAG
jgi:hypothetical protein